MVDVFISYSRRDRSSVEKIVDALKAHNFSVWFDAGLTPGNKMGFNTESELQLNAAKAVLVCWSRDSVESLFVKAEALKALEKEKMCPVLLDGATSIPLPFNIVQAENLSEWKRDGPSASRENV